MLRIKQPDHDSLLSSHFVKLFEQKKGLDVSVCCEGKIIRAHKAVLSSYSEYFKLIFDSHSDIQKYPIIIVTHMSFADLKLIIEYMYYGEINIPKNEYYSRLLVAAQSLQISGLRDRANCAPSGSSSSL